MPNENYWSPEAIQRRMDQYQEQMNQSPGAEKITSAEDQIMSKFTDADTQPPWGEKPGFLPGTGDPGAGPQEVPDEKAFTRPPQSWFYKDIDQYTKHTDTPISNILGGDDTGATQEELQQAGKGGAKGPAGQVMRQQPGMQAAQGAKGGAGLPSQPGFGAAPPSGLAGGAKGPAGGVTQFGGK